MKEKEREGNEYKNGRKKIMKTRKRERKGRIQVRLCACDECINKFHISFLYAHVSGVITSQLQIYVFTSKSRVEINGERDRLKLSKQLSKQNIP